MRFIPATVLILLASSLGRAQADSPEHETVQQLVAQVKELQQRVKVLESRQRGGAVPEPVHDGETTTPAHTALGTNQPESQSPDLRERLGIQWRGFGEVNYKVLDQRLPELGTYGFVPGSAGGFYTGAFDLLLTSKITGKANVLSEIVFEELDAQAFRTDLQRLLFNYDFNDYFKVSVGRYHTAIGYYNTAFHSGTWLQTTADRPLIMEFAADGGFLPTQAVGVSVTGQIPSGALGLNYIAEYGSSDTIRPELNGTATDDENNGNHINLGLFARPGARSGLQIGGSLYHDRISDFRLGPSVRLGQTIANLHLVYVRHGVEFLNEGFLVRHAYEKSSVVYNMPAFYTQISKRFGQVRPFLRYQYVNANPGSLFQDISLRHGPSFGARYDFNDNVAFKTQLDHTLREGQPDLNGLHLQLAFTF